MMGTLLLSSQEVPPVGVVRCDGTSPFFIVCDHAGQLVPRALKSLGLSQEQLASHIAWDIGALGLARCLGAALDASVMWQRYSRLVVDCNRPLEALDSIVRRSERTDVPGNQQVAPPEAEERAREIFRPYHDEIAKALDERQAAGRSTVLVSVHTFTPVFLDVARPWHIGVLSNRDRRVAEPLLRALRDEGDLVVGDNEPYAAGELTDYTIVHHAERRGLRCVEIEIRQDLVGDQDGQEAWAARLARRLPAAVQALPAFESQRAEHEHEHEHDEGATCKSELVTS